MKTLQEKARLLLLEVREVAAGERHEETALELVEVGYGLDEVQQRLERLARERKERPALAC